MHPDARLARILADFNGEAEEFVAEFELSFVLFLLLPSLPALEHWKAVLHLVSRSPHPLLLLRTHLLRPVLPRSPHAPNARLYGSKWRKERFGC